MVDPVYLRPGRFVESEAPDIISFARQAIGDAADPTIRAIRLFTAVRDQVTYDPYVDFAAPESFSAKAVLAIRRGFCIPKAALLAAGARSLGIAARLGFADVRNHLASPRLVKANNGDVFRWHAFAELWLDDRWVKATPAFDMALCQRCGIHPLDFDGRTDSVFHPFDQKNQRHMEYVEDRGIYADVPIETIIASWREASPALFDPSYFAGARAFAAEVTPVG